MRRSERHLLLAAAVTAAVTLAWTEPGWSQGILNTRHNLSSTSGAATPTGDIKTAATDEVCVFCHTPHGSAGGTTPLWNRKASAATYTPYTGSDNMDTTPGQPTGVSLLCLSCHDGTVALDALRNQPGSGGLISGTADSAGWTFAGAGMLTDNKIPGTRITNLGSDLRDDHPISIIYGDAKSPSSTDLALNSTAGFTAAAGGKVERNWGATTYSLPLYNGGTEVQCATCHEPHTVNALFLRGSNTKSQLCRTCHLKDG